MGTPGSASGLEKRTGGNTDTALQVDSTAEGQRVAIFYTKVHNRLLRPLLAANTPPAHVDLRQALHTIDRHVHSYIDEARLGNTA